MFGLFKKKESTAALTQKPRGFFSTHEDFDFKNDGYNIAAILQRTFQKTVADLKPVDRNGKPVKAADGSIATMDEAYCDLTLAKMENTQYGALPIAQLGWYASQGFIGYQMCAMLSQQWLIAKACAMPARDAVRHGWELTINDGSKVTPETFDKIRDLDKQYKIKTNCVEFVRKGRVFGIRLALFNVESPDPFYYEKPFNIDGVRPGSYRGISQIDPYWIGPELNGEAAANPASMHFYEPTWWRVNGRRIHRTHLIIMRNDGDLPDILKPTYFYGGVPVPQKIAERVYAAERTANEAPMLAITKRLTVLNVDVTQAFANKQAFSDKMEYFASLQNNFGVKVVGESEEINQFDTSLNDLDAVIMTQYQLVSAASEVPATKLMGTSPKGFGASGEYEESSYHEMLESIQEHDLTPLVERHYQLLVKSELQGSIKGQLVVTWKPTDTPTAKEQAEINLAKAQGDMQLVTAGAVDGTDVRQRIINDPDSGYNGIAEVVPGGPGDREAQQEAEAALEQPVTAKAKGDNTQDAFEEIFDPVLGVLGESRLITHQKFLDEDVVAAKREAKDYTVNVTPPFLDEGKKYRMIIDGHHSLAAAVRDGVHPTFITSVARDVVFNAITRKATDGVE